ncbi:EF-hand calcium-binding domain-containing protein 1-like [Huso huso]|uniref:EF-hand calcium-binding domain-containing protein 1-like n=1 Tax=Huso huso TaxID=61971 RepID=A0ABR0Z7C6_HUSHU
MLIFKQLKFAMKSHLFLAVLFSLEALAFSSPLQTTEGSELDDFTGEETALPRDAAPHFTMVELPAEFKSYDVNKDGAITLSELSGITETNEDDASQPFHTADVDGNGVLTTAELQEAPWVFRVPEDVVNPVKEDSKGHLVIDKVYKEAE